MTAVMWPRAPITNYILNPQSFDLLAAFHPDLLQAIISTAVQLSAAVFLATRFKFCSPGLPMALFFRILPLQGCLLQTRYPQLYALSMSGVYIFF